jgi:radial spoke head protein 4A
MKVRAIDLDHGSIPAWSSRACSQLSPVKFSTITLRSNRWPGASVIAYNDKFANIYIGDGLKDLGNPQQDFIAPPLGAIQKEYAIGENTTSNAELLVEQLDPTVEQEEQYEEEQRGKDEDGKEGDGEGDGEEEEE